MSDLNVQKEINKAIQALVIEKETVRATMKVWGMVFSAFLVVITPVITAFLIGVFKS